MTEQEKAEKPRTAAVLAQIEEIPAEKRPEKRRSIRDGIGWIVFAGAGLYVALKLITPPPMMLVYAMFLVGAYGGWIMSEEMSKLEVKRFFAIIGDGIDRILGRTPPAR